MTRKEYVLQQHPEQETAVTESGMKGCCADFGLADHCEYKSCLECWEAPWEEAPPKYDKESENDHKDKWWLNPCQNDPVNHPEHYTAGGIECIDAITAALCCQKNPVSAWLTGQIIKYLWRWPLKNGAEDLRKARFYLERLISREELDEDE